MILEPIQRIASVVQSESESESELELKAEAASKVIKSSRRAIVADAIQ